jgi:serine/threonine protein kinase/energy-coupling factor transporter ATP-binding protein EcfA2
VPNNRTGNTPEDEGTPTSIHTPGTAPVAAPATPAPGVKQTMMGAAVAGPDALARGSNVEMSKGAAPRPAPPRIGTSPSAVRPAMPAPAGTPAPGKAVDALGGATVVTSVGAPRAPSGTPSGALAGRDKPMSRPPALDPDGGATVADMSIEELDGHQTVGPAAKAAKAAAAKAAAPAATASSTTSAGTRAGTPAPIASTSAGTKARDTGFGNESQAMTGEGESHVLNLPAGAMVEQYEIIRELGRGGMGQVFMARDTRLGRVVAIKFLTRGGESFTKRFLVEAQTTARCTHENIVVIHEAASYKNHAYMVLEYLEGEPLSKIIKGRTLSAQRTIEIMVPVVRALIRAHAFGIVHRDLKPDNIYITNSGTVKVLDFGVAKLFGESEDDPVSFTSKAPITGNLYETLSTGGRVVGTLPFMSPEQFGADVVDERTDLWALGIIMFRLLSGQHPLTDVTNAGLMFSARDLDAPHRSLGDAAPNVPDALIRVVDKLLRKRKQFRYDNAESLLADLEALQPTKAGRRLGNEECPYLGLSAFDENDADRFFGRAREVSRAVGLLRDNALLAIVGPSGAGKSSFVRAGLIPELKSQGITWETFIIRPGRDPMASLVALIGEVTGKQVDVEATQSRLRHEPGYLGQILRDRARQKQARMVLMVDQFEELYTLVPSEDERNAVTRVLMGVADDTTSPLRLVLSFRSDFLHRIAENSKFADNVMRGLLLLGPPDKEGLREAIVGPAEKAEYAFENNEMVDQMLADLKGASAPYPLMQFCLSILWAARDSRRRILPQEAFVQMGGVAGALATHADQIIATLSHSAQQVARAMFQRLVTSEGTRAIVDLDELQSQAADPREVDRVLTAFVDARLLVMHQDTRTVEIVHEALVQQWPMLRRWMDEGREDVALVEQVRLAAKQWDAQGRNAGMLWRGQAAKDAVKYQQRFGASLAAKEREFLDAVIRLDKRSGRRRRVLVSVAFAALIAIVAIMGFGIVQIRGAEAKATAALADAQKDRDAAKAAQAKAEKALADLGVAEQGKAAADAAVAMSAEELAKKNAQLVATLSTVEKAKTDAEAAKLVAEEASKVAQKEKLEADKARATAQDALKEAEQAKKDLAAELKRTAEELRKAREKIAPI